MPGEPFVRCQPIFHKEASCLVASMKEFVKGSFPRSLRMYLPVHFLPMLLFQPKKVFADPWTYMVRKTWNTLRSSFFLSVYIFNMRVPMCWLRNWFEDDTAFNSIFGGFMTGLSIFIEHAHRRVELALYVLPRALEIMFRLIPETKAPQLYQFLRWRHLPMLSFQVAIALWMTIIAIKDGRKTANQLNMTVLRVIFGTHH